MTASKKGAPKKAASRSTGGAKKRGSADPTGAAAKRAAEAAAGLRNGRRVWFVLRNEQPHRLQPYYSEEEADAARDKAGAAYLKMGPYMTAADGTTKKKIEWIRFKLEGDPKEYGVDPEQRDALFWSMSALDKFFFPYYTMLYGPDKAAELRKQYDEPSNESPFMCHDPLSDPCNEP